MHRSDLSETTMEEQHLFQPLSSHISKPLFQLSEIYIIKLMVQKDQQETKDLIKKGSHLFKTTTGLVMNKNGNYRDIRLNLTTSGDLLTPLDIAQLLKTHKTSKETSYLLTFLPQQESLQNAPSGKSNKMVTDGIQSWLDQDSMEDKRSTLS